MWLGGVMVRASDLDLGGCALQLKRQLWLLSLASPLNIYNIIYKNCNHFI